MMAASEPGTQQLCLLARLEHVQPVAMKDAVLGQHLSPGGATSPGTIIYALPAWSGHVQNVGVCQTPLAASAAGVDAG